MVEDDRLADRTWFRVVDDSKRSDTLGNRRTSRWILRSTALKDAGARTLEGVKSREREGGKDHERKDKQ